jgi:hypothetical protein
VVPTPDLSQDPTGDLVLGDPITEPGLPTYYAMPDGLIERTGRGWVVTVDRPMRAGIDDPGDGSGREMLPSVMFVVAPDGTHFLVGRFEADANVYPVAWTAGSPTVDVIVDTLTAGYLAERPEQDLMPATYDMRTGTFTERDGDAVWPPDTSLAVPRSPSGRGISVEYDDGFTLWAQDGSSTRLAYGVPGKVCAPVGWLGDDAFLALCVDEPMLSDGRIDEGATEREYGPVLAQVDLDGTRLGGVTELRNLAAGDPLPGVGDGVLVRDGVVAFPSEEGGPYGCWTGADLWTGEGFKALQRPEHGENSFAVTARDGIVYVEAWPGCSGDAAPATLTAHDLTAGTTQVMEPAPDDWWAGEPGWVTQGLVAWVVAE